MTCLCAGSGGVLWGLDLARGTHGVCMGEAASERYRRAVLCALFRWMVGRQIAW